MNSRLRNSARPRGKHRGRKIPAGLLLLLLLPAFPPLRLAAQQPTSATAAATADTGANSAAAADLDAARYPAITHLPLFDSPRQLQSLLAGEPVAREDPPGLIRRGDRRNPIYDRQLGVEPRAARRILNEIGALCGRFESRRAAFLWIVHRAELDDPSFRRLVCGADYVIAEELLPRLADFDFSPYRAVLYFPPADAPLHFGIIQRLQRYARSGGTIMLDMVTAGLALSEAEQTQRDFFWYTFQLNAHADPAGKTEVEFENQKFIVSGTHPFLFYGETLALNPIPRGFAYDGKGNLYPLTFQENQGNGKWIFLNLPALFHPAARLDELQNPALGHQGRLDRWNDYQQRSGALNAIVAYATSDTLIDYTAVQTAAGEQVCCAWTHPHDPVTHRRAPIRFKAGADWKQAIAFNVIDKAPAGGGVLKVRDARLEWREDFPGGGGRARLWVVKPVGAPALLYADGDEQFPGSIDSGVFDTAENSLRFFMAHRAWVSAPARPRSIRWTAQADPQKSGPCRFQYDPLTLLLTVDGPGEPAEIRIEFNASGA